MALAPTVYTDCRRGPHAHVKVWLVNTGWIGEVRSREADRHRLHPGHHPGRADRKAGRRRDAADPNFGLHVPRSCPDVPSEVLDPRSTWKDREAYDQTARKLAGMLRRTSPSTPTR